MLLDIRPDHLELVKSILQRWVPGLEVWVFGSRAKWTAKDNSDLDLCIVTSQPLSFEVMGHLQEVFSDSDLPYKVDVVDWSSVSKAFQAVIARDKVVVQPGRRVSPKEVTRQVLHGASALGGEDVGLRCANPTYEWPVLPLEDCLDALIDYRGKTPVKTDFGIPLITAKIIKGGRIETPTEFIAKDDYDSWMRRGLPQEGDVVLTVEAPLGEVAQLGAEKIALAQRVVTLRGKAGVLDSTYLLYLLQTEEMQEQLKSRATGTTVLGIKQSELRKLTVALVPFEQQKSVAAALKALDDRITLLRETNATLEAIAQALFKSWFVDFDPVRAKMEGRAPEGMDEATAALFPDGLEESALGLVPRGWRVGTLADLSDLNPESWNAKNHPDTVAYIDLANAKDNEIASVTDFVFDDAPSRARRVLRDGDTIVGTVRPGNRSFAFIRAPASNLTASTGFAVLRPTAVENTEFVYLAATQDTSIEHLAHVADGGAYPAVRPDVVSGLQSVLPNEFILVAFHDVAAPLLSKVAESQKQAQTLAYLRDTMLPRLISGQLRLSQVAYEN